MIAPCTVATSAFHTSTRWASSPYSATQNADPKFRPQSAPNKRARPQTGAGPHYGLRPTAYRLVSVFPHQLLEHLWRGPQLLLHEILQRSLDRQRFQLAQVLLLGVDVQQPRQQLALVPRLMDDPQRR